MLALIFLNVLGKILQFHLFSWCGNFVERHSFQIVLENLPKRCGNCAFSKSLYTRKLGEIKIFFTVIIVVNKNFIDQKVAQNHYFYITTLFIAMAAFGRGYDLYSILFFFTVVF